MLQQQQRCRADDLQLLLLLRAGHWMAGFWPGVLWQLHALTGKPVWAEKAQLWQSNLAGKQREFTTQHDWGESLQLRGGHSLACSKPVPPQLLFA